MLGQPLEALESGGWRNHPLTLLRLRVPARGALLVKVTAAHPPRTQRYRQGVQERLKEEGSRWQSLWHRGL